VKNIVPNHTFAFVQRIAEIAEKHQSALDKVKERSNSPELLASDTVILSESARVDAKPSSLFLALTNDQDKDRLVRTLRAQKPEELDLLKENYQLRHGRPLEEDLKQRFRGADQVEVLAYARQGRMDEADSLRLAIVDKQGRHAARILNQKTEEEVAALRKEYSSRYHRDLDADLKDRFSGGEKERLKLLLEGEPTRRPGENDQSYKARRAEFVARQLESALKPQDELFLIAPRAEEVLDILHGRDPQLLRAVESTFDARNRQTLDKNLRRHLSGTKQEIALNYLDDGRECAIEKLRRAFRGNNDEELIRRTLRSLTPEERKALQDEHSLEIRKLFTELDRDELPEMEALLEKGRLDTVDHVRIAIADGNDRKIISSLRRLSPEERQEVLQDGSLLTGMYDRLASKRHQDAEQLLKTGEMSVRGAIEHAESAQDLYRAAARAQTKEEKAHFETMEALMLCAKFDLSQDRLKAHLERGALSPADRILLGSRKDLLPELRGLSAENLKELKQQPEIAARLRSRLSGSRREEALAILENGPLPTHESLRFAVRHSDSQRALEVLQQLKDNQEKTEALDSYRRAYRSELVGDLDSVMSSRELRQAEQALWLDPNEVEQVSDRVRKAMLRDRDDNSLGSSISNGITNMFSDSGYNLDDQAREVEAEIRRMRRQEHQDLEKLRNKEVSFQDSRWAKAEATRKIADIAVPVLTALVTAGLGSVAVSGLGVARLIHSCAGVRSALVASSVATRLGLEKAFRGNDFGSAKEVRGAVLTSALETASILTGARSGLALSRNKVAAEAIRDGVSNSLSVVGQSVVQDTSLHPGMLTLRGLGGVMGQVVPYKLLSSPSFWKKRLGNGVGLAVNEAAKVDVRM
jgi:hypothetical protein